MDATTQSISDRLDILERRCSRLRLCCAACSAIALTACLSSALRPVPSVLEAQSFVVLGTHGETKAKFGCDTISSSPGLVIYNGAGEAAAILSAYKTKDGEEGAMLHLESGDEDEQVFAAVAGKNRVGYMISNEHLGIESWVKPGRSSIHFTTAEGTEHSFEGGREKGDDEDASLLRLDVVGDKPSIDGRTPEGDVIFKQSESH